MHIKKISKNKEPFIKITFRSMKELKGYRDGIRNTCNTVTKSGNICISAETLLNASDILKKPANCNKETGESFIILSADEVSRMLPLFFCMTSYISDVTKERNKKPKII